MGALAHMIETRGIATTVIGLIRPHLEATRPPRSLWVSFPLGRPLGEPENAAFQRKVLLKALRLLERADGPVILEEFTEDAPSMSDAADWRSHVALPPLSRPGPTDAASWADALRAELAVVRRHWEAAQRRFGRTTVGVSGIAPEAWAAFASRYLTGEIPDSPTPGLSGPLALRYLADDLKALYSEAVQAEGPMPSAMQVSRWFWSETLAADFLRNLRQASLSSQSNGFGTVGGRFLVPAPFILKT